MKIVHVCKKYPKALGGDAVVVSNLRKQQEAAGHEVVIVTSNCPEIVSGNRLYKYGLKDTPHGLDSITARRLFSLLALCFRMYTILHRERPDVIHTHSVDMAFCVALAARFFRIPIIHTFHIVTFYDNSQSIIRRKIEIWLAKKINARIITAPNNFDVERLQQAGLKCATLLSNGVDVNFWERDHASRNTEKKKFTFVSAGRLERQKGYSYLIEAVALLAKTAGRPFNVIVAGEGTQMTMLSARARALGLENIVQFVGSKDVHSIRELLHNADAAVFPSLYETTPLTLLEAWAAGVPVVMTATGILRDITPKSEAAYVVPVKNSEELMAAMRRCMQDAEERQKIADNGRAEVQQYAWPIIARSAENLYRRAV